MNTPQAGCGSLGSGSGNKDVSGSAKPAKEGDGQHDGSDAEAFHS